MFQKLKVAENVSIMTTVNIIHYKLHVITPVIPLLVQIKTLLSRFLICKITNVDDKTATSLEEIVLFKVALCSFILSHFLSLNRYSFKSIKWCFSLMNLIFVDNRLSIAKF